MLYANYLPTKLGAQWIDSDKPTKSRGYDFGEFKGRDGQRALQDSVQNEAQPGSKYIFLTAHLLCYEKVLRDTRRVQGLLHAPLSVEVL